MITRFNIVKKFILPELPYRFKAIPFTIPISPFKETGNSKIYMELQKIEKNKNKEQISKAYTDFNLQKDGVEFAFNLQKFRQC